MSTSPEKPKSYSWSQGLVIGLLLIGLALTIIFSVRSARSFMRLKNSGLKPGVSSVDAIRAWMTVPYIAHFFHVPESYVFEHIGIPETGNRTHSLEDLNRRYAAGQRNVVLDRVKAAIRSFQAAYPAPAKTPP